MKPVTVGISPCPNDVFTFAGLILGAVPAPVPAGFRYADVETLNGRARAGLDDVIKISCAAFPACRGAYAMLACGGALGRGCGPLLLTGGAPWDPAAEVLVPGARTTANFLLDHYLRSSGARPPRRHLPFDEVYRALRAHPGAQGVVIHEQRFTYAADGVRLVADLGAHWEATTGFPIPLGLVAAKRGAADPEAWEAAIRASLDWAHGHRAEAMELCARHAQDMEPAVMAAHVGLYVNAYTRDIGPDGRAALDFFFSRVEAAGAGSSGN